MPKFNFQICILSCLNEFERDNGLKGIGNIVQMRDSGAKVVTSMLDVQLKII